MQYPTTTATVETLPNGLTVILDPDPFAPAVSAQWWVETGSIHEDTWMGSGVSHFLEHMVFKGTRDFSGEELAHQVQAAGGHWNAYTTFDRTVYYIDGPADALPLFLQCLSGMVLHPTLPESEFAKEQEVIRREIDMGLDDPDHAAMRLLLSTAFRVDPRRHPVIGHRHHFDALTHADLVGYHRARYTTDRSFVVISGDFAPSAALASITALTHDATHGTGREPWVPHDAPQLGARRARETFALPHTRLGIAWKIPPLQDPLTPAFEILASLLGQGRSSRLYQRLREKRGLALEISSYAWNSSGCEGLFGISADCETAQCEELREAILREVEALALDDLDAEAAKAKRRMAASQFRSLTTASGRAADLASNWHEARDLDFTRSHIAALMAVTTEDLRVAAQALTARVCTVAVLDPQDAPASTRPPSRSRPRAGGLDARVLSNGLTVAMHIDPRVPLVHLQAAVLGGQPSESVATGGLNQLLAACLPKGTASRDAETIALTLESLGASASAAAGNNSLMVQAAGLAPDMATIADVWCELITAPSFPAAELEREKASQVAAWKESLVDPLHTAMRSLRSALFGPHGYGLDPLGSGESLAAIQPEMLERHHARHVQSANMTLAVAGDIDPSAVVDALEAGLARLPRGTRWSPPASVVTGGKEITTLLPKKQAVLCFGFPGSHATDENRHALAMIHEYAADMAGPLFTRIREELGLAYQVGATQFLGHDAGLFTFYLATSPDQIDLAREEMRKQIQAIAEAGIPADAFERVRATVLSAHALRQQSPAQMARQMAIDALFGLPADHHRALPGILRALTPEQVREVAAQTFSRPPAVALVLPDGSSGPAAD